MSQNLSVLNGFNQPQTEHRQRNTKREIACSLLCLKIWLPESAVWNRGIVDVSTHDPELMHAAIASAIGFVFESYFANRPVLCLKRGNAVLSSEAVGN